MNNKMMNCKICNAEIAKSAKKCPYCGAGNIKPFYSKWWFYVLVFLIFISVINTFSEDDSESEPETQTMNITTTENKAFDLENSIVKDKTVQTEIQSNEEVKTEYNVGDILQDGDLKIVYMQSGEYIEENDYLQPEEGYKYIFLKFAFENIGNSDQNISFFNYNCYADGYAAEAYYGGYEGLSATLSSGRTTEGYVYFTVPENATNIEVEYTTNYFTSNKINFTYTGDADSNYVIESNATVTEGALKVEEKIESSSLNISYLACGEYVSDNMFIEPAEGNKFIYAELEFENKGTSDEYISSLSFDCYADGASCEQVFILDKSVDATISAGRKTKGFVIFEISNDASIVEIEYLSNYWTSNRIVFSVDI